MGTMNLVIQTGVIRFITCVQAMKVVSTCHSCATGRAIRRNIQFEVGSIGLSAVRDNTEAEN